MGEGRNPKMYSYVSKTTVKPARKICNALLASVRGRLQAEGISMQIKSVGSAKVNLVTQNGNEPFDLDFNILVFDHAEDLGMLKRMLLDAVKKEADAYGFRKVQDSTSAVTCIHYQDGTGKIDFHMDLGIIVMRDRSTGCRLIHDKAKGAYFLNEPVHYNELEQHKSAIKKHKMVNELRKVYLEKKNYYLREQDRHHPSFVVYAEAVNQVYQKIPD